MEKSGKSVKKEKKSILRSELKEYCSIYYDSLEELEFEVKAKEKESNFSGTLCVTSYKLHFIPDRMVPEQETGFFMVPYGYIESIKESSDTISITCKDERVMKYKFDVDFQLQQVRDVIKERCFPAAPTELMCRKMSYKISVAGARLISHADI